MILSLLDQIIIVIWQWLCRCSRKLSFVLLLHGQVKGDFRRLKGHGLNEVNVGITSQLPCKVEEGLLKVVVALSRNFIVLQVLLPVEGHLLSLNLPVLHVNLVTTENNGDVLTHPAQVPVPRRDILVGQP